MGAGNPIVLKETFKSLSTICDEIIYGDLMLFQKDRELVRSYRNEFNLRIFNYEFNFIFKNGFSDILNSLASWATNDLTLYMNTSEIISVDHGAVDAVVQNADCNAFYFDHAKDPHRWFRLGDRRNLKWSGLIHEQLSGEWKPYHRPIFTMADLEKDMEDPFKAKVLNSLKELVYFEQYIRIADDPTLLGETDPGWLRFAKADYDDFKRRLHKREKQYEALQLGDYEMFMKAIHDDPEFEKEKFVSSNKIEFQGDKKYLL